MKKEDKSPRIVIRPDFKNETWEITMLNLEDVDIETFKKGDELDIEMFFVSFRKNPFFKPLGLSWDNEFFKFIKSNSHQNSSKFYEGIQDIILQKGKKKRGKKL